MVAKEQQSQPLASQSPPAWASHTEHMMTDSSEGGKQPHDDTAEAIVADYYGSYSNSPQSQNSSNNSLLTLSPRSSTSQASNPGLDFTKNMKYNNNTAAQDQLKDANMNIALNLDSGNKKSSRVRKATPSKCAAAAAVNGGSGGSSAASSARSLSTLKCQLCSFTTQSRLNFSEHLGTHCSNLCETDADEFTKLVLEQLNGNLGANDDLASPAKKSNINNNNNNNTISNNNNNNNNNNNSLDIPVYDQSGDELGLRVPRVSAQGKVKLFRCKQCPYVAIVKVDFWDHSRQHIKPEKLLTCPKCPFVTEYKHHLEYHLRNHFGSKPFKCEQCDYSCVNKSMLNSHLKSHSDVYQFRCNECAYATKYCHSLKLHLRKYDHTPSVVLNTDGTPNPLPIVDVYGTRRGPKTKSDDTTPPPQDIVSVILPTVVNKLQPARQKQQQQQQQQQHRQSHTPPQQPSSPGSMQPAVHSPQYNFGSQSSPDSSFGRFNSPIGGPAAPQLPITPASSPKSPAEASYMNQGAAATIHLLSSLGGSGSFNPYAAAAAMQASSQVAETSSRAGLRRELRQLTSITNPAFLGSTEMAQRVMSLTLSILAEGVKNAESLAAAASNEREKDNNSDNSSSTDTASSQDAVAVSSSLPLDLSKASKNCCEAQDLTKNRPTYDNEDNDDDGARTADDDYDDAEDDEDDVAGEPPAPELEAIVATLCKRKRVMRSVHGSLSFLRQYLMFLRAAQLQSLCYM